MGTLVIEDVDLAALAEALRGRFAEAPPLGYLSGRTALRDAVTSELGCSELEAENIVDTLVARGFVSYGGHPQSEVDEGVWSILN